MWDSGGGWVRGVEAEGGVERGREEDERAYMREV